MLLDNGDVYKIKKPKLENCVEVLRYKNRLTCVHVYT